MRREYFERMIPIASLSRDSTGDRVVFDHRGDPVDIDLSLTTGPAVLVVAPVTDAVKRVERGQVESLDRDGVWSIEAIAIDRFVLQRLEADEMSAEELLTAVPELGYPWEISRSDDL